MFKQSKDSKQARAELHAVLSAAPKAAPEVLFAISAGKMDGRFYNSKTQIPCLNTQPGCMCVRGHVAKALKVGWAELGRPHQADPLAVNPSGPLELYITGLRPSDSPDNNSIAQHLEDWTLEWFALYQYTQ